MDMKKQGRLPKESNTGTRGQVIFAKLLTSSGYLPNPMSCMRYSLLSGWRAVSRRCSYSDLELLGVFFQYTKLA